MVRRCHESHHAAPDDRNEEIAAVPPQGKIDRSDST
jgi:hypothetical protein